MISAVLLSGRVLALEPQVMTGGAWALFGDTGQSNPQNPGNKATFGFLVTSDDVVLIDPNGS